MLYFLVMAFRDVLRPRVLALLVFPFIGSLLFWGTITYLLWGWLAGLGVALFQTGVVQSIVQFLSAYFVIGHGPFVFLTNFFFVFAVIIPLALITYILLTSIFLVPVLVEEIRKADFPTLVKKSNSIFAGTTASLSLSAKYFFSWVGTIPLWAIVPGGNIIVPFLLLSWFNSRLFTWEVMVELTGKEETKTFLKNHSAPLWGLGLLTSLLYFVPLLNFIAPVITAAAFSRYCLRCQALE